MSAEFGKLLKSLPSAFDREAHPEPAIQVAGQGSTISLVRTTLTVDSQSTDISSLSLQDVVDWLNGSTSLTATLLRPDLGARSARLLLEFNQTTVPAGNLELPAFNNLLWVLLRPIGFALEDLNAEYDDALTGLNLLTATGFFADLWGKYLGIRRKTGESDQTYTARMKQEIIRARVNNQALEQILVDDFSVQNPAVTDLLPFVFIFNETVWDSYWPGNIYNSGAFTVSYQRTGGADSRQILSAVEKHKASGTRFILQSEEHVHGPVSPAGRVQAGAAYVWDGRYSALIVRARVDLGPLNGVVEVDVPRRPIWRPGEAALPGSEIGG